MVDVTLMGVLLFVLHVCMLREFKGIRVTAMLVWGSGKCGWSEWVSDYMDGTRGSGFMSHADDMLEMRVICGSSSSSCHQTILFHSSAHWFLTSLNITRSSNEQGCASWEHCNMCAVVYSVFPQAHVVSLVYNYQFSLCALLLVYPVRRWLIHLHVVHGLS